MASWVTPLMVKVLQISRKCWRCALASSCVFPQNWFACTMLMRAGLISNPLSPTLTVGPNGDGDPDLPSGGGNYHCGGE